MRQQAAELVVYTYVRRSTLRIGVAVARANYQRGGGGLTPPLPSLSAVLLFDLSPNSFRVGRKHKHVHMTGKNRWVRWVSRFPRHSRFSEFPRKLPLQNRLPQVPHAQALLVCYVLAPAPISAVAAAPLFQREKNAAPLHTPAVCATCTPTSWRGRTTSSSGWRWSAGFAAREGLGPFSRSLPRSCPSSWYVYCVLGASVFSQRLTRLGKEGYAQAFGEGGTQRGVCCTIL